MINYGISFSGGISSNLPLGDISVFTPGPTNDAGPVHAVGGSLVGALNDAETFIGGIDDILVSETVIVIDPVNPVDPVDPGEEANAIFSYYGDVSVNDDNYKYLENGGLNPNTNTDDIFYCGEYLKTESNPHWSEAEGIADGWEDAFQTGWDDWIVSDGGNDTIYTGKGDDHIDVDIGDNSGDLDVVSGGEGADTIHAIFDVRGPEFYENDHVDMSGDLIITDFSTEDVLYVTGGVHYDVGSGASLTSDVVASVVDDGSDVALHLNGNGATITLEGIGDGTLDSLLDLDAAGYTLGFGWDFQYA